MERSRPRRLVSAHPLLADAALALVLFVLILIPVLLHAPGQAGARILLLVAPLCVVLAFRRCWPVPVLGVTVAGALAGLTVSRAMPALVICLIAVYTVASHTNRRTAITAGILTAAALGVGTLLSSDEPWLGAGNVIVVAWTGMATAAGDAVRSRRAYVAAVEERARRAEQSREEEALRRVAEERLRIARELHDVVAHSIALINVQAGVAAHLLRERPEAAEEALAHVRVASRTVLDELGAMLSVLRQSDDPETPAEPAPGLDQLDELIETFRAAGLTIEQRLTGSPQPLTPTVGLAAYRIVQESLTNAQKHGAAARATLAVAYEPRALAITVRNPIAASSPIAPGTGHGLLGMRERAAAVGGELTAKPTPTSEFVVSATLPLPP